MNRGDIIGVIVVLAIGIFVWYGAVTSESTVNTTINTRNGDGLDYLVPSDFGNIQWQWQAGLGVDVFMFAIDVRYFGGLNDLVNKDVTIDVGTYKITSRSNLFQVTVGWKIF